MAWPVREVVWGTVFGAAGTLHFVHPHNFDPLVPSGLPGSRRQWTYGSGIAELGLAAAIVATATVPQWRPHLRDVVAPAAAAFLVGVWPGNVKMAWDWRSKKPLPRAIAFARVPLQVPMIASVRKLGQP